MTTARPATRSDCKPISRRPRPGCPGLALVALLQLGLMACAGELSRGADQRATMAVDAGGPITPPGSADGATSLDRGVPPQDDGSLLPAPDGAAPALDAGASPDGAGPAPDAVPTLDGALAPDAPPTLDGAPAPDAAVPPPPPGSAGAGPVVPTPGWDLSTCDLVVGSGGAHATIQGAINAAAPGDKICVKNGTYHERLVIATGGLHLVGQDARSTIIDGAFTLPGGAGQGPNPKGIPGVSCSEDQSVADDGPWHYACSVYKGLVDISGNGVTMEGFKIARSRGRGIRVWRCDPQKAGCTDHLVKNVTLRHLRIDYTRKTSIYFRHTRGCSVRRADLSRGSSHTEYNRPSSILNHGASGIGVQGSSNLVVARSIVHQGWGETLIADGTELGSSNLTIEDNVFYDNWRGLYLHGLNSALVQRNLFYNSVESQTDDLHSPPFAVTKSEPNFVNQGQSENIIIINNIVATQNNGPRIASGAVPKGVVDVQLYNNVFFSRGSRTLNVGANIDGISLANNIFYHDQGQQTVDAIVSSTTVSLSSHNCFSDGGTARLKGPGDIYNCKPQFVGADGKGTIPPLHRGEVEAEWFRLRASSPLVDQGLKLPVTAIGWNAGDVYVVDDYFQGPRPVGAGVDIGVHEQ